ncbi:hypothetical protein [Micromonospora aurantiaca (nom. illeg.)]|uniref:hypothetical protein n=1 Tax=Micromonospora aurantiaca (nom. illeg.) TaxID=47850 RepID=UPI0036812042
MSDPMENRPGQGGSPNSSGSDQSSETTNKRGPSQGQKLRTLADDLYTTYLAPDGRLYGSRKSQPGRALRHGKPSELVKAICRDYLDTHQSWPSTTACAELADYLEAVTEDIQPVPIRCHWDSDDQNLYLDIGDKNWTTVAVGPFGFQPDNWSPVPFRRGSGSAMPWPLPATGDLAPLWNLVPVTEADRPIVLALLITAWMTGTPQPVVLLTGPQDSGKTTTAQYLLSLIDPVSHQRGGSLPEREDEWKARVSQARVVFVDNTSHITAKVSDLLCRVATGGELTTRQLYTNDGAHVSDLLVPVWLTSIDAGVLRGDLQSRIVPIELEGLTPARRKALSDLRAEQEKARPVITRALLDLTSDVISMLPEVDRGNLTHRMTDFNLILRCIDLRLRTTGESRLAACSADLAGDVLDADPVALAVMGVVGFPGALAQELAAGVTAARLLAILNAEIKPEQRGNGWPGTPRVLSTRLARVAPALQQARGIAITASKSNGAKLIRITKA